MAKKGPVKPDAPAREESNGNFRVVAAKKKGGKGKEGGGEEKIERGDWVLVAKGEGKREKKGKAGEGGSEGK